MVSGGSGGVGHDGVKSRGAPADPWSVAARAGGERSRLRRAVRCRLRPGLRRRPAWRRPDARAAPGPRPASAPVAPRAPAAAGARPTADRRPARGHHRRAHPVGDARDGHRPDHRHGHQHARRDLADGQPLPVHSADADRSTAQSLAEAAATRPPTTSSASGSSTPAPSTTIDDARSPGQTADFTHHACPRRSSARRAPGVYWFGVHALGAHATRAADDLADGRARTFIPLVPPARAGTVDDRRRASRSAQRCRHAATAGSTGVDRWAERPRRRRPAALAGRLRRRRRRAPVTWLVDPAVLDAVAGSPPATRRARLGPDGRARRAHRASRRRADAERTPPPSRRRRHRRRRRPPSPIEPSSPRTSASRATSRRPGSTASAGRAGGQTRCWPCRTATSTSSAAAAHDPRLYDQAAARSASR